MADANPSGSPLETVADAVDDRTVEAFELLNSETRLAILLALWGAKDQDLPFLSSADSALSFSELRERVGIRHGQQFNYHLDKLVGQYVHKTDEGYEIAPRATQVIRAVLAGTLADQSSFDDEPLDGECHRCGGSLVLDYDEGALFMRCTNCEGVMGDGKLVATDQFPPAGLAGRTPDEAFQAAQTYMDYRVRTMIDGVCPECGGTVTTSLTVCEDHRASEGEICERCGTSEESMIALLCDVCGDRMGIDPERFVHGDSRVRAFLVDHGGDPLNGVAPTPTEEVAVLSMDPPEVQIRFEYEGDRLDVTLDEDAQTVDVTESTE